jgi:hypothetical protein
VTHFGPCILKRGQRGFFCKRCGSYARAYPRSFKGIFCLCDSCLSLQGGIDIPPFPVILLMNKK